MTIEIKLDTVADLNVNTCHVDDSIDAWSATYTFNYICVCIITVES